MQFRATDDERNTFELQAQTEDKKLSEWVRDVLLAYCDTRKADLVHVSEVATWTEKDVKFVRENPVPPFEAAHLSLPKDDPVITGMLEEGRKLAESEHKTSESRRAAKSDTLPDNWPDMTNSEKQAWKRMHK